MHKITVTHRSTATKEKCVVVVVIDGGGLKEKWKKICQKPRSSPIPLDLRPKLIIFPKNSIILVILHPGILFCPGRDPKWLCNSVFRSYFQCGGNTQWECVGVGVVCRVWVWRPLMSVTVPYLVYTPITLGGESGSRAGFPLDQDKSWIQPWVSREGGYFLYHPSVFLCHLEWLVQVKKADRWKVC